MRRCDTCQLGSVSFVSIHAPLKGATWSMQISSPLVWVSIHAPLKGATIISISVGGIFSVSIHAPLKGATAEAIGSINRGTIAPFLREQMYYKKESTRIMLGNIL